MVGVPACWYGLLARVRSILGQLFRLLLCGATLGRVDGSTLGRPLPQLTRVGRALRFVFPLLRARRRGPRASRNAAPRAVGARRAVHAPRADIRACSVPLIASTLLYRRACARARGRE